MINSRVLADHIAKALSAPRYTGLIGKLMDSLSISLPEAHDFLCKAHRDLTKLVRVQRMAARDGKSYQTHVWVKPEQVRKNDIVVQGREVYEAYLKQKDRKDGVKGIMGRLSAAQKKNRGARGGREDTYADAKTDGGGEKTGNTGRKTGSDKLSAELAKTGRERRLLDLINGISDAKTLQLISDTGIVPEDEEAREFASERLFRAYRTYIADPKDRLSENRRSAVESLSESSPFSEKETEFLLNVSGLMTDDFSAQLLNPCENISVVKDVPVSVSWLHSVSLGDMTETFGNIGWVLAHIGETQPELAKECRAMQNEWLNIAKTKGNTLEQVKEGRCKAKGKPAKQKYSDLMGRVLHFFGTSLVTDTGEEVTDYASIKLDDAQRMHFQKKATPEREAVIMNLMVAQRAMGLRRRLALDYLSPGSGMDGSEPDPGSFKGKYTYAPPPGNTASVWNDNEWSEQVNALPTFPLSFFKASQDLVNSLPLHDSAKSVSAGNARAWSAALRYAPSGEGKGKFFSEDPTPVKDAAYGIMQYVFSGASTYREPSGNARRTYSSGDRDALLEHYYPEPRSVGDLRAEAFEKATCSLRVCTAEEQANIQKRCMDDWFSGIADDAETKKEYEDRQLIMRKAYVMNNSRMEEAFKKKVEEEGLETHTAYNGISFNGMCGVCRSGAYRVPKDDEDLGSGAMLGFGIYEAYSPAKSMMYAGSTPFSGKSMPYAGNDGYSDGYRADGVISLIRSTYGAKSGEFTDHQEACAANKNSGGDCDAVICRAKDTTLAGDEACLSSADMMYPEVLLDVGARMRSKGK